MVRTFLLVEAMMASVLMLRMKMVWNMSFGQSNAMPAPTPMMTIVSRRLFPSVGRFFLWKSP